MGLLPGPDLRPERSSFPQFPEPTGLDVTPRPFSDHKRMDAIVVALATSMNGGTHADDYSGGGGQPDLKSIFKLAFVWRPSSSRRGGQKKQSFIARFRWRGQPDLKSYIQVSVCLATFQFRWRGGKKAKFLLRDTPLDFSLVKNTYLSLRYAPSDSAARMTLLWEPLPVILSFPLPPFPKWNTLFSFHLRFPSFALTFTSSQGCGRNRQPNGAHHGISRTNHHAAYPAPRSRAYARRDQSRTRHADAGCIRPLAVG